jgi:hypothetical protein
MVSGDVKRAQTFISWTEFKPDPRLQESNLNGHTDRFQLETKGKKERASVTFQ